MMIKHTIDYFKQLDVQKLKFDGQYFDTDSFWNRCAATVVALVGTGLVVQIIFYNDKENCSLIIKEDRIVLSQYNETEDNKKRTSFQMPEDKNEYFQLSTAKDMYNVTYDDLVYMHQLYRLLEPQVWEWNTINL